ncbi:MAG TPA: hypothetical protein VHP34_00820 [Alphaproteobacteria bacterium]|nr:hypothetical protein [Alphaproteobacteria bacterium]
MADEGTQEGKEASRAFGAFCFILGCANMPVMIYAALHGRGYLYMTAFVLLGFALFAVWLIRHRRRYIQDVRAGYTQIMFFPCLMFGLPLYFCLPIFFLETTLGWDIVRQNAEFIKWLLQIRLVEASAHLDIGADSNELDLFLVYKEAGTVYIVTLMLYVTVLCTAIHLLFFAKPLTDELVAGYGQTKVKPFYALCFWLLCATFSVYYIIHPTYLNTPDNSRATLRHAAYALLPGMLGFCLLSLAGYFRYLYAVKQGGAAR